MAAIQVEDLCKAYGSHTPAVHHLNLDVQEHEFVTLLGPSGCGKTTTLRLIAGFLKPDQGRIWVGRELLSSAERIVPPERRRMGMVFQNYAVWPHKTVYDNVVFGLQVRRVPDSQARQRVNDVLELVHLSGLERRYPNQLSGGQQQRVALARSLVVEPDILLLDEPLSNLDARLREQMRWELKALQRRTGITFVYVTHDQAEAMALSDRIAVMHAGELQQYGTPHEVYTRPSNRIVADFMGLVNLAVVRAVRDAHGEGVLLGSHRLAAHLPAQAVHGQELRLAIRPEHVSLSPRTDGAAPGLMSGVVEEATFLGNMNDCFVALEEGVRLRVQTHPTQVFEANQPVYVEVDAPHCAVVE